MEKDWTCIFRTKQVYEAELRKGMLEEHDIEAIVINKKDSLYLIGEAELYVRTDDVLQAKHLISRQDP
jgi:hypothetical protein